jgi:hypothetical protein
VWTDRTAHSRCTRYRGYSRFRFLAPTHSVRRRLTGEIHAADFRHPSESIIFWYFGRSSVFINSTKVVDNDGSVQASAKRCGSIALAAGLHSMYIEGWAQSSALSMSATYQGPDTMGQEHSIQAVTSPQAPSPAPPLFPECPSMGKSGDNNFTICAFKASNEIDLTRVDDVQKYYSQVSLCVSEIWLCSAQFTPCCAEENVVCGKGAAFIAASEAQPVPIHRIWAAEPSVRICGARGHHHPG